jgi:hypothetical protein
MISIGERYTKWILNEVKVEEYVKNAIIKGKEIDALKSEGRISNIEDEFKIVCEITKTAIPQDIVDFFKTQKEVKILKQERDYDDVYPQGVFNSVLEHASGSFSDKMVISIDHKLEYEQIKAISERIWAYNEKLVFIICPGVELSGRIITNHNTYENVELARGFIKETEDGITHNVNMLGDFASKTKGQKCKSILTMRMHKYTFLDDNGIQYIIFSNEILPLGKCKIVGTSVPINDRRKIGEEAKNRTVIDLIIVSKYEPFKLQINDTQALELRQGYTHEFLISKFLGKLRHPEWFEKLLFSIIITRNNFSYPAHFLIIGPSGSGKCHGKGTKIMMYDGTIKNVEDVKKGDLLMGDDSTPRKVLSTIKGEEQLYKINQKNGESYVVNQSHILSLEMNSDVLGYKKDNKIDMPLTEYLNKNKWFKCSALGYKVPLEFKKQNITIEPYFLGHWLANGSSRDIEITSMEKHTHNYIKNYAKKLKLRYIARELKNNKAKTVGIKGDNGKRNHFMNQFRNYNLILNKHIPQEYKLNDKKTRLELLAGLLDGDGYLHDKCFEIIQKNKMLSEDIVWLARSLGLRVSIKKVIKGIKSINFKGEYYRIYICGDTDKIPTRLKRKQSQKRKMNKNPLRTGISVEQYIYGDYYGFEIDGNHRYLLGDFTVTHNTRGLLMPLSRSLDEISGIISGTSTIKGLIPNFKESPPDIGYLCKSENVALVDEMFNFIKSSSANGEAKTNFGILKDVLDHEEKAFASGNGTIKTIMHSILIAATNEDKYNGLISVPKICENLDRPFLSRLLVYKQTESHIDFVNNRKNEIEELKEAAYPVLDQKFISIFNWLSEQQIKDFDIVKSQAIFDKYINIIPGITREIYQGRYRHHLKCIIAGVCKYRWLINEKNDFSIDDKDYEIGEELFVNVISSWLEEDEDIKKMPLRARLNHIDFKQKMVYDIICQQKIKYDKTNSYIKEMKNYLEISEAEIELAYYRLRKLELLKVIDIMEKGEFIVPFWYGESEKNGKQRNNENY